MAPGTERGKILVIDDDESMRDSCSQVLKKSQYIVETAENGLIGIEKMTTFVPDLVLLDLKMPGLGGMEVLHKLRDIDPYLIVVIITGYASVGSAVDAMKQGVYDYLPKPFTPDELRIIVKRGLSRRRFRVEAERLRREKEIMRKNFVSLVSHELRSPLAAVQQNLMVINGSMSEEIPDNVSQMLQRMSIRIKGLLSLISDWLDLSRIESGEMVNEVTDVDIIPILTEVIDQLEPLAEEKQVSVSWNPPNTFPMIKGDAQTIQMLFTNLIHNAIKYNLENGQVDIETEATEEAIQISVKDSGVGIAEEKLPLIFEQFFRVKEEKSIQGSGLGLSIAGKIVEAHNGDIDVESELGKGTTFTVKLPITQQNASASK